MSIWFVLLIPIVLIFIIMILLYAVKREHQTNPVFFTSKRVKWLFTFYVIVLLIGCVASLLIPVQQADNLTLYTDEDDMKAEDQFYEKVYSGQIEQIENIQQLQSETFLYQGSDLQLQVQEDQFITEVVVVEQKHQNDGLVEVLYYSTRELVGSVGYSEPFQVIQKEDSLTFSFPERIEFEFAANKQPFPVSQFSGEDLFAYSYRHLIGQNVIYIKIPADVQLITGDDFPVHYIVE
ncbi:hypothetical protein [Alkalihalobacterium bogoriense]|uniref:hypothetical protein n=1 Tax=Alkalihalobacterium bogoriense TaxID=246272 RepID=UPI00047B1877|nr:hypothetical protein [Alkalihalobacterium bogoriense]